MSSRTAFPILRHLRLPTPTPVTSSPPSELSAVHRGLAFEKRSLRLLSQCLSMSLQHVGGKSDGGIDLQGWWWVPTTTATEVEAKSEAMMLPRKRIRVFAQCKAEKKKLGPHYVRELEGVLYRHQYRAWTPSTVPQSPEEEERVEERKADIVGVLISESPFTKSALVHANSSIVPFLLLHIPRLSSLPDPDSFSHLHLSEKESELGSIVFNHALSSSGGPLRGQIEARWERSSLRESEGRPGLWWKGRRIPSWVPQSEVRTWDEE